MSSLSTSLVEPTDAEHSLHHAPRHALDACLDDVRAAPSHVGTVELLLRRPAMRARELLTTVHLTHAQGVEGDTWDVRGSRRTDDGTSHPDMQLNVMSARAARAVAGDDRARWAWAGDQLYLDLDLSPDNLPAGTRLALGTAVIEVTDQPHTGCLKFRQRFGKAALAWVNSPAGKELRLRGVNARVVTEGTVSVGDAVRRL